MHRSSMDAYLSYALVHQLEGKPNVGQLMERLDVHKVGGSADRKQKRELHFTKVSVPLLRDVFNETEQE